MYATSAPQHAPGDPPNARPRASGRLGPPNLAPENVPAPNSRANVIRRTVRPARSLRVRLRSIAPWYSRDSRRRVKAGLGVDQEGAGRRDAFAGGQAVKNRVGIARTRAQSHRAALEEAGAGLDVDDLA